MFGILDLVPESRETVIDKEIQRQFTVMALDYSDILCLSLEVRSSSLTVQHLQSINHNYPSIVEEIFEQVRFRVGRTVRQRKEAIEFYHQKKNLSANHSDDELVAEPAADQSFLSEKQTSPKNLLQENEGDKTTVVLAPEQNPLNLRQIDELSESNSNSSINSSKNSR